MNNLQTSTAENLKLPLNSGSLSHRLHFLNTQYTTTMSGKCVIKANDMNPQMSKFATKVGVEALQSAQTEQVRFQ